MLRVREVSALRSPAGTADSFVFSNFAAELLSLRGVSGEREKVDIGLGPGR